MTIDNFDNIAKFLTFDDFDHFYIVQILKRKKDPGNEDMSTSVKVRDTFYIDTLEDLYKIKERIIEVCQRHNARAYINLNRRSYEKVAFHTLSAMSTFMINRDYKSVRRAYDKTCGQYSDEAQKKWLIDFDSKDYDEFRKYQMQLEKSESIKYYGYVETPNGYHFIVGPCNPEIYRKIFGNDVAIQKNNPTVLYAI
jgi:hypothetical protein